MGLSSKISIEIDGTEVMDFVNLEVLQNMHTFNSFKVVFRLDAFEDPSTFILDKSKNYIGKPIKINIEEYDQGFTGSKPAFFFKGIITEVNAVKTDVAEMDQVILSGYSPDILLNDNPGNYAFLDKTLREIVESVLRSYPRDLLKFNVDPTFSDRLPYIVQYNETRFEFLKRLANRFGEWFYYDGLELQFGSPPSTVTDLSLGFDLLDFGYNIQLNSLNTRYISYDPQKQGVVTTATNSVSGSNQLNDIAMQAHRASMKLYNQQSTVLYNHLSSTDAGIPSESKNVVERKSAQLAINMSKAQGTSQNPRLKIGNKAAIKATGGSGTVDYGEYTVTSILHTCNNLKTYKNHFEAIPSKAKFPLTTNPDAYPRAEMQNAEVTNNKDPEKLGRIKVKFFWQTDGGETPWIRIAYPNAGKGTGFFFIPEIGEEVMVGFEGGDAENPFVFGSFYNGKNKPEGSWASNGNDIKILRTRGGNTIELIDKGGSEEISIYQENDKSASHHITMTTGPTAEMKIFSKDKLVIEAKSIEIKANAGNIDVNATNQLNMESKSDMSLKGMNLKAESDLNTDLKGGVKVKVEGGTEAEMKGSLSVSVEGGAKTTIKGALVMIN